MPHPSSPGRRPQIPATRGAAHITGRALIVTTDGSLLLVQPSRLHGDYHFPGAAARNEEPPGDACDRAIFENLNLHLTRRDQLLTAWAESPIPGARSEVTLLFDYGIYDSQQIISHARLNRTHIDDWALISPSDALEALAPSQSELLQATIHGVRHLVQRRETPDLNSPYPLPGRSCLSARR